MTSIASLNDVESGYFGQARREMLPFIPSRTKRLLDVGCGAGDFGALVKASTNAEVWGIEFMSEAATLASAKLDRVIVGDVMNILGDIPVRSFDCITCNDIIEHLTDPWAFLRLVRSTLTDDGRIVCSIPNVRYWDHLKAFVLHGKWEYTDHGILDRTHIRFFTKQSIKALFSDTGFELQTIEGINPSHSRNLKLLNAMTFGSFDDARFLQFACVAKLSEGANAK